MLPCMVGKPGNGLCLIASVAWGLSPQRHRLTLSSLCSSEVEQLFRKQQVVGSTPTGGSGGRKEVRR